MSFTLNSSQLNLTKSLMKSPNKPIKEDHIPQQPSERINESSELQVLNDSSEFEPVFIEQESAS